MSFVLVALGAVVVCALPSGVVAVTLLAALVIRPLLPGAWEHLGGFVLLAGVGAVLTASVWVSARPRR